MLTSPGTVLNSHCFFHFSWILFIKSPCFWWLHLLFPFLSHISNELEPSFHINLSQLSWVSSLFSRPGANFPILTGGYAGYGGKGLAKGWQPPARKPPPTVPADYQDHCYWWVRIGDFQGVLGENTMEYNWNVTGI